MDNNYEIIIHFDLFYFIMLIYDVININDLLLNLYIYNYIYMH